MATRLCRPVSYTDGRLIADSPWTGRHGSWLASVIAGDPARGLGILNNELYRGRVIWNRNHWLRSAADSSKRRCVQNPQSEWIVHHDPSLQIVEDALWRRVREVQQDRARAVGARVKQGIARQAAASTGPGPRYLFSTLIACAQCGANFVMVDARFYGCSSHKHGGRAACPNDFRVKRVLLEDGLLEGIRRELLAPEAIEEFRRRVVKRIAERNRSPAGQSARVAQLEREIENLTDAIAGGVLRTSPAVAQRLATAEGELGKLRTAELPREVVKFERLLPRVVDGELSL